MHNMYSETLLGCAGVRFRAGISLSDFTISQIGSKLAQCTQYEEPRAPSLTYHDKRTLQHFKGFFQILVKLATARIGYLRKSTRWEYFHGIESLTGSGTTIWQESCHCNVRKILILAFAFANNNLTCQHRIDTNRYGQRWLYWSFEKTPRK